MNRVQPIHASELRQMLRKGALLEDASARGRRDAEQQEVLTLVEVAGLLRIERHQVAKLVERGLPCRRVGSMRRFIRQEVMAWLKAQKETK